MMKMMMYKTFMMLLTSFHIGRYKKVAMLAKIDKVPSVDILLASGGLIAQVTSHI
jgi:hypothetical protein